MFEKIIHFSVSQKFIIALFVLGIIAGGIYSLRQLPIDAVPDITTNQVQVVTVSPTLAPQEVEQLITFPIELSLANIPNVEEIRSISRYGLSVVTVVFKDRIPILDSRQFVQEQLNLAQEEIPPGLGSPELMPITTGLGEIYQYTLEVAPEHRSQYDAMELRTIQDWIVKRQLSGIPGIIEISSFGGYLKQYEIAIDPLVLSSFGLTLGNVFEALEANNQNSGGSYIEKNTNAYYIRSEGRVNSIEDIESIAITHANGMPVLVGNVAKVSWGSPKRYGAMTKDGQGEAVGGIALMLKGANSSEAIRNVQARIERIQGALPEGVSIQPYLDRSDLVNRTIDTVSNNLIEGGLIVILVLLILLGNWRAGLIVASVIPLSMLFAFILMNLFGVSANLMSLGAIDFGIVVDGAVIIVENSLMVIYTSHLGKKLNQLEMDEVIKQSSSKIYQSAAFGVLIILVVFLPIVTLTGIEGKMFKPMALTVSFALVGAMLLSLTYVPMMASLTFKKKIQFKKGFSDKLIQFLRGLYQPVLETALQWPKTLITLVIAVFTSSLFVLSTLGSEFIPTLEEGDLAMQMNIPPGSSLQQSIKKASEAEDILIKNFPEVEHVISKIGTSEVPTDPMAIEDADIMIILKPKDQWTSASDREELAQKMKESLGVLIGASFEFTQPIQLRFNELITGAKTDIAIKIFGEDVETLARLGQETAEIVENIQGAGDVKVEQTEGLSQMVIKVNRQKLAYHHVAVQDVNQAVRTAYAGEKAGVVFENEKRFDMVIRFEAGFRSDLNLSRLFVSNDRGELIPLSALTDTEMIEGPMQITRENAQRRITVGVNIRNRDVASLVEEIKTELASQLDLPPGYYFTYGGQFESLEAARKRLSIAVPVSLFMIFVLLFFAFKSVKYSLLIFSAVPMSAIGGILALWSRGMPFSISAGIGFIALFGVAVLNGIVMISYFNQLKNEGKTTIREVVINGSLIRLRPVLITATVAALGFLPMALSSTAGAEVQKPLATVVIGGLVSSTLLTLFVLPILYIRFNRKMFLRSLAAIAIFLACTINLNAQETPLISMEDAVKLAETHNANFENFDIQLQQSRNLEKATFTLGNTALSYQQGQINDDFQDWMLEITQNLGNPFYLVAARQTAESRTDWLLSDNRIKRRALVSQVQMAWAQWYFSDRKRTRAALWLPAIEQLNAQMESSQEEGDISFTELVTIENLLVRLNNFKVSANQEFENSLATLNTLCGTEINGKAAPFDPITWVYSQSDSLSGTFQQRSDAELQWIDNEIKLARSSRLPELSVGYFEQQIVGVKGLNGIKAGISIPLLSSKEKNQARNMVLKKTSRHNEQQQNLHALSQELEKLQKQRQHLLETLQLLPSEEKLEMNWEKLLALKAEGEINIYSWVKLLEDQLANFDQLVEIRRKLTLIQIEIHFLTQ